MAEQNWQVIEGILEDYFEMGMDSVQWSVYDTKKYGTTVPREMPGLYGLENGDLLTVFNDASRKEILWQGEINLEYGKREEKDGNITHEVFGNMQTGVDPESWAQMFHDEKPALLVKKYVREW